MLTFDDGPWPENTPAVLKALAEQCLKATFFEIGKHAIWHPEIVKQVMAAAATPSARTPGRTRIWRRNPYASDLEQAKEEIEMGISAVHLAVGGPIAPFFRFPALQHPPELVTYLAERNIAIFSTDIDSFDFKMRKPEQVIKSVMDQAGEARQRHHPDARLPARHRRGDAGAAPPAQGRRLQGRAHGAARAGDDAAEVRRDGHAAGQAVGEQHAPERSVVRTIGEYIGGAPPTGARSAESTTFSAMKRSAA